MASPNIKIGQYTYNDISRLQVDRVEGGTVDYIYSGIDSKRIITDFTQVNFPNIVSIFNTPQKNINISVEVKNVT